MVSCIGDNLKIKNENLFIKRNLKKYVSNSLFGAYGLLRNKKYNLKFYLKSFITLFLFYFLKKIYIPQVEFLITTNCTLNCEECSNYIPYINQKNKFQLDYTDYKKHINNLLKNVYELNSLIIVGGEPLLHPQLFDILEYSITIKKIKKIYLYTNCTVIFSDKILNLLSKNKKKFHIYLSNYSKNPNINHLLKIYEIKNQLENNKISYTFDEKLIWVKQEKIENRNRNEDENKEICSGCGVPSVSAINGKLHYCPKATAAELLNLVEYNKSDYIDLNFEVNKDQIIDFYSNDNFTICKYCSGSNVLQTLVKPAKQIKDE